MKTKIDYWDANSRLIKQMASRLFGDIILLSCPSYHREFHVAVVSPPVAPTVTKDPVAFFNVHTNDVHCVVNVVVNAATAEDAALVIAKLIRIK